MKETNEVNSIKAGEYYLKLMNRKGKILGLKDDEEVFSKLISKYGFSNVLSDANFKTCIKSNITLVKPLLDNLKKYDYIQEYDNVGETLLLKLSSSTLSYIQGYFLSVFEDNLPLVKKMVEKCTLDKEKITDTTLSEIDDLLKKSEEQKGYSYKFLYNTLCNVRDFVKDDEKLAKIFNNYNFLQSQPSELLKDLIKCDTKKITKCFTENISIGQYNSLMSLFEDAGITKVLKTNCNEIEDFMLRNMIETEIEKDIFDDLYKNIFKDNVLKENCQFSKEICLTAIENNIDFLCSQYPKSYNSLHNGYNPERLNKSACALVNYLKETNGTNAFIHSFEKINNSLGNKNEIRDVFEHTLREMKLDTLTFFDKGSNCVDYIEEALLLDANLYEKAKELAKGTSLKVNDEAVEKIAYQLVRFPPQEMLKNEANSRIIFTINNEFAKERMRKKCDIDK